MVVDEREKPVWESLENFKSTHEFDPMSSLSDLRTIEHGMSSIQYCAECGISDTESKLESDEDRQLYCSDCWQTYYSTLIAASESLFDGMSPARAATVTQSASTHPRQPTHLQVNSMQLLFGDDESTASTTSDVAVVVPIMDYCSECGTSATESKLEMDDDEQYYCSDCWENHFNSLIAALDSAMGDDDVPPPPPASPPSMVRSDSMPSLIDDEWPPTDVDSISVVVPSTKCCVECGASERESKLVLDDDKEYYCTDCWDHFLSTASDDSGTMSEGLGLPD